MKNMICVITALLLLGFAFQSCGDTNTDKNNTGIESPLVEIPQKDTVSTVHTALDTSLMQAINRMMEKMNVLSMSEDFDLNFIKMMIIHLEATIDMAHIELAKGNDRELKTIAGSIISKWTALINKLEDMANHHRPKDLLDDPDNEFRASLAAYKVKLQAMKWTGKIDHDFASMMIPHHERAIDMATEEVLNGHHVQIKLLARDMLNDFQEEVEMFRSWL